MTEAQQAWLNDNPNYQLVGKPRADAKFVGCGTLYPDGSFDPMAPMKPVKLVAGPPWAVCVGIRVHANT
jgi:hypothetical protein